MIELSNSKLTQLSGNRFALDSSIDAIQMREPGGLWQDIKPRFIQEGNLYVSTGTPYRIEFGADGERRIYPDRTDLSKYLRFPAMPFFKNLVKTWNPFTREVKASAPNFDIIFGLKNSRITFRVVFRQAPTFSQIALDVDSVGFDLAKLLLASSGLGIPKPRLVSADGFTEKPLEWKFQAGQLTLDLDFTGLTFPVTLHNTTLEVSVGASDDDTVVYNSGTSWFINATQTVSGIGYYSSTMLKMGLGLRFLNMTIANAATISAATLTVVCGGSNADNDVNSVIIGEDADDAAVFSTLANYQARRGTVVGGANDNNITAASITWNAIAAWTIGTAYTSPDFTAVVQEIVNRAGWVSGNAMVIFFDDHANNSTNASDTRRRVAMWDHATYAPPLLHVEYTEAVTFIPKIMFM